MVYSHVAIGDYVSMRDLPPALRATTVDPPAIEVTAVAEAVELQFGLRGGYEPLVSERDQNFRLHTDDGRDFVIKIVSGSEPAAATAFQIAILRHLHGAADIIAPQVVPTIRGDGSGEIADAGTLHTLRAVTWIDGEPLETRALDEVLARQFGVALARLDVALQGFTHPGENQVLAWDLQRVADLRGLLDEIDDTAVFSAVSGAMDDYESRVLPIKQQLPSQVIHGDANPGNVLTSPEGIAFIDFSDGVKAPRIFDLAIAAAYLRPEGDDPSALIAPFIAGYQSIAQLEEIEQNLLFDLVRARLATTITLLYWRLGARDVDDPYRQKTLDLEKSAAVFLRQLDDLGRERFVRKTR